MEDLRKLLTELGVPPVIAAAVVLMTIVLLFFVKRALDQRHRQKNYRRETLKRYLLEQEGALFKAYRINENVSGPLVMHQKELVKIISQTDDIIMEPFTRYRAELPLDVKAKIYNDIHSILTQFKPDPTSARTVAPDAVRNLVQYRQEFLQQIESVKDVVNR